MWTQSDRFPVSHSQFVSFARVGLSPVWICSSLPLLTGMTATGPVGGPVLRQE